MEQQHDGAGARPDTRPTDAYEGLSADEALAAQDSSEDGLSSGEAARRLRAYGPNEVAEKRKNPVLAFLKRYWGPMPWLLELAMVLALAIGHATEAVVIFILLTINAVIGQAQSASAARAVALLKKDLLVKTRTLRDGSWTDVTGRDLVPGDVISLALGNLVPADAFVLAGEAELDCSSLTGESLPRPVGTGGIAPSSAVVTRGALTALVVNTGAHTVYGKTISLVQEAHPRSRQQELLFLIVRYMMYAGVAASVLVGAYALATGHDLISIASLVVTFLMGAVPVALPAVLAIVQAAGAMALSHEGVLVTRLDSVEDAAALDVFCFDKTGTITQNQLEVTEVIPAGKHNADEAILLAALSSTRTGAEAIDAACLRAAEARGIDRAGASQLSYTPFEPETKRTEATARLADDRIVHLVKGAPKTVLDLCGNTAGDIREDALSQVRNMSERGLRAIALACAPEGSDNLQLVGILGLSDPPRKDATCLIERLRDLGIRCLMLTGDDTAIAREVAGATGIGSRIRPAHELAGLNQDQQVDLVEQSDGFAEVLPADKHAIVSALQHAGHAVGMTGDGVNDAPALRQAELGCAVFGATDVARASASAVLMNPGLQGIVDAITESRRAYQRMLTWVINKVTKVMEVVVLFTAGYFITGNMLVSLLGMSLLIFANDFATMSIASDNVTSTASPNSWNLSSIVKAASVLGALFALEDLLIAGTGHLLGLTYDQICTLVMYALVVNSQVRILTVRERRHLWASVPSSGMLAVALLCTVGFTIISVAGIAVPAIPWQAAALTLGICLIGGLVIDLIKVQLFRIFGV